MGVTSKFMKRRPGAVTVGVASLAVAGLLLSPGTANAATITSNSTGMDGNCFYSFWTDTAGSTRMTTNGAGNYQMQWTNTNNQVGGLGWRTGSADKVVNYSGTFNSPGNGYLALYGWTRNPLVEYYVIESWGSWKPPGSSAVRGTVTSDGGTYDIYITDRINQPSIEGTSTFKQYWSVRQQKKVGGTITVKNHFDAWARFGLQLGTHDYMIMATEGYQSSGSSNITVNCSGSGTISSNNSGGNVSATIIGSTTTVNGNTVPPTTTRSTTANTNTNPNISINTNPNTNTVPRTTANAASGSKSCTATVTQSNDWNNGFTREIRVTAGSSAISGWRVTANTPSATNIISAWNASRSGNVYSNVGWNSNVAAGASTGFGLQGVGSASGLSLSCTAL